MTTHEMPHLVSEVPSFLTPYSYSYKPIGLACQREVSALAIFLKDRLRLARESAGLKQVQSAEMIGVSPVSLNRWETGKREPSAQTLSQLANLYGCDLSWLVNGEGDMHPPQVREPDADWIHYQHERERQLIKLFRQLHPAEQDKVIEIAQLYAGAKEPRAEKGGGSGLKESNSK